MLPNAGVEIALPKMTQIEQMFPKERIENIRQRVEQELARAQIAGKIKKGMKIAIGVGSRGIGELDTIVESLILVLKARGAEPFVVPAMGSHGGANAEGQRKLLATFNITEERLGVPVVSSMEVEKVGSLPEGIELFFDKNALSADGIIPVNRIKLHTGFHGDIQSGILKMMVIGFGNHRGATSAHRYGVDRFSRLIPEAGQFLLSHTPVLFGFAIVENAFHKPARIEAIDVPDVPAREKELLKEAIKMMPRIPFSRIDVLIVDESGKNIAGPGMDPNVTGRFAPNYLRCEPHVPEVTRLIVRNLTDESYGNAGAIGVADIVTRRLVDKIDFEHTYVNIITAGAPEAAKIPLTVDTDHEALSIALKTCFRVDPPQARVVRIKNTLELDRIWISEALVEEAREKPNIRVLGEPREMTFDGQMNLSP